MQTQVCNILSCLKFDFGKRKWTESLTRWQSYINAFFQHCYFKVSVNSNRWISRQNFMVQLWKNQCLTDVKIEKDFTKIHCMNNFCRFIHFLTHVCVRFQVFLTLISTIPIRMHFQLSSQTQSKLCFCSAEKTHLPENCTQKYPIVVHKYNRNCSIRKLAQRKLLL